jgi:polyphenol oxidase
MVQSKILNSVSGIKYDFLQNYDGSVINSSKFKDIKITIMEQMHGVNVIYTLGSISPVKACDGLITDKKGIFLGVKTADCMPIFIADLTKKIVGVIHSGWKGLLNGILDNTILQMISLGSNPNNIISVIGPHIGSCCYEIDEKRMESFYIKFGNECAIKRTEGKLFLDLAITAKNNLVSSGFQDKNIEIIQICTCCNPLFPSYRRDGIKGGRMLSIIGFTG